MEYYFKGIACTLLEKVSAFGEEVARIDYAEEDAHQMHQVPRLHCWSPTSQRFCI